MDALEVMRTRRSTREFVDRPVPNDVIEKMVDCGRCAPTARGEEPWEFIAITDKAALAAIADMAENGKFVRGAACALVIACRDTKYYLEDGCAATENVLLAAADLGVGACWIAGDKKPYADRVLELVGLGQGYNLVSIIALGYPVKAPTEKKKRPLENVLHWGSCKKQ